MGEFMKFTWKGHTRAILMGLFLSLGGGACSSQQQQQEAELQLEQEMSQDGEQGQAEELDQEAAYQQGENSYDGEESEEALSQNQNSVGEGEYANAEGEEESYNTANNNELESLIVDEEASQEEAYNNGTEEELVSNNANLSEDLTANTDVSENELTANAEEAPMNEAPMNEAPMNEAAPADMAAPVAQAGEGLPEAGSKMSYVVQRGETLSTIAQNIYGNRDMWREMATLTGMENPNRIYPGDVVYYQLNDSTMAFATAYENVGKEEVTVQSGDTLASIARNIYGDEGQWKSIWRQNDQIDNPDRLEVGQVIYFVNSQEVMAQTELIKKAQKTVSVEKKEAEVEVSSEELETEVKAIESLTMLNKAVKADVNNA